MSIKTQRKIHLFLFWPAIIAMVIYIISALAHPLMAWTGPQAKKMFAPSMTITNRDIQAIPHIITKNKLIQSADGGAASISKLVPFKDQVLLQVTQDTKSPRRYFSTHDHNELHNHDEQQAIWLAEYFNGEALPIKSLSLQTEFNDAYPSVNRLLPVYQIEFNTPDNLSMYIHTETMALAGITNDWKRTLSFIFKNIHSFDWLNTTGDFRVLLVGILTGLIFTMACTGLYLLIKIKRVKNPLKNSKKHNARRFHRILAWVTVVPLILFSASGLYHLFMQAYSQNINDIQLTNNIQFSQYQNSIELPEPVLNMNINRVSLFDGMYRISVSPKTKEANSRVRRFSGRSQESKAIYIDAKTGGTLEINDQLLAKQYALNILSESPDKITNAQLIHRFGPTYDFRNKRLPVWQIDFDNPNQDRLFIDPINNILIDKNASLDRFERYSFSFLHKWNMLTPITGRFGRDIIICAVLTLCLVLTTLGFLIRKGKRGKKETKKTEHIKLNEAALTDS